MRHAFARRPRRSRAARPSDVDAGREHQPVVVELVAVGERHRARRGIDAPSRPCRHERDAVAPNCVVAELLRSMSRSPAMTVIAERAGGEVGLGSTSVTASAGSSALQRRARAVAPAKPPPITTTCGSAPCASMAAAAWQGAGRSPGGDERRRFGSVASWHRLRHCRYSARRPGRDRLDLVGGEALDDTVHHRGRRAARCETPATPLRSLRGRARRGAAASTCRSALGEWQPEH